MEERLGETTFGEGPGLVNIHCWSLFLLLLEISNTVHMMSMTVNILKGIF